MVPIDEIADPKNDFNLNLPRYIDSSEPEDLHDLEGHLRGGIPERDLFVAERDAIGALDNQLATLEQDLDETRDENGSEDGLLVAVIEGEGDKQKITAKAVKARLKEIGADPIYADERAALEAYAGLLRQQSNVKAERQAAQKTLDLNIDAKYPMLTEAEIKALVVDSKWMARLSASLQSEIDRVSQKLNDRIHQLAERYATPLPALVDEVGTLSTRVDKHLKRMGATQ